VSESSGGSGRTPEDPDRAAFARLADVLQAHPDICGGCRRRQWSPPRTRTALYLS
jgi:hypothetical protein